MRSMFWAIWEPSSWSVGYLTRTVVEPRFSRDWRWVDQHHRLRFCRGNSLVVRGLGVERLRQPGLSRAQPQPGSRTSMLRGLALLLPGLLLLIAAEFAESMTALLPRRSVWRNCCGVRLPRDARGSQSHRSRGRLQLFSTATPLCRHRCRRPLPTRLCRPPFPLFFGSGIHESQPLGPDPFSTRAHDTQPLRAADAHPVQVIRRLARCRLSRVCAGRGSPAMRFGLERPSAQR